MVVYFTEEVPALIPVATPVVLSIVATVVLVLLQVPPVVASLNVVVLPIHTPGVPVIGARGLTVMVVVVAHPAAV